MSEATRRITSALNRGLGAGEFPGAQVYASINGEPLADVAIGEARLGTPMTPETIVPWQCNTKPVTGVAAAQLWEQGLVDIDAPIATYLPDFAKHGKGAVTLRHVLSHSAKFAGAMTMGINRLAPDEQEAALCDTELAEGWPLGGKTFYSMQLGSAIAAAVVARVDGRPFPTYVREAIFGPLGMNDCWIGVDAAHVESVGSRMAFLYDTVDEVPELPLMSAAQAKSLDRCSPGTGGVGPMRELGRLYESLLASLSGGPGALLKGDTVRAMVKNSDLGGGKPSAFGIGLMVASGLYGSWFPRAFGHEGLRFSMAFADPESGAVVSAMVNGLPRGGSMADLHAVSKAVFESLPRRRRR